MHDTAGIAAVTDWGGWVPRAVLAASDPKPRMVAATATPIASSVITVNAPLATDRSARSSVISRISAKKPAAASVSHIGNVGERQISSSDDGQAQFMAMSPKPDRQLNPRNPEPLRQNRMPNSLRIKQTQNAST